MFIVTGVTGHVGSLIANKILAGKRPVQVIERDAAMGESWRNLGAEVALNSVEDQAFLTNTLRGARGLFSAI